MVQQFSRSNEHRKSKIDETMAVMMDAERKELNSRLIDLHHIEKVIGESDRLTTMQKLFATQILLGKRLEIEDALNE